MLTLLASRADTVVDKLGDFWAGLEMFILVAIVVGLLIFGLMAFIAVQKDKYKDKYKD